MRAYTALFSFLLFVCLVTPCHAQEEPKPESIVGKMSFKFVRGITNVATSVVEIPKQSYLTVRDQGGVGYVVGPIRGLGMTIYRAFIGSVETVFFMVPQPGYYDPMVDPDYVWNGWEDKASPDYVKARATDTLETNMEKKGE
jgi:putative exosortase-associated protein (TIGR04073 family)